MKEQPNPITHLRQAQEAQTQTAAPLERLILREGKLSKISGENIVSVSQSKPINIPLRTVMPEDRRETYLVGVNKLISRYCPNGFNAYLAGEFENNNLPIVYYRI